MTASPKFHSLDEVAAEWGLHEQMSDPVRWLTKQINHGPFTGRRVGRSLCMTREDMTAAEELMRVGGQTPVQAVPHSGLSAGSMKRRLRSAS